MHKLLLALALTAFSGFAFAGDKVVYTGDALVGATVDSVVAKYADETKQTVPAGREKLLLLVNGSREGITQADAESKLASAKSVEVMGQDGTFVVNIITK